MSDEKKIKITKEIIDSLKGRTQEPEFRSQDHDLLGDLVLKNQTRLDEQDHSILNRLNQQNSDIDQDGEDNKK